PRLPERHIAVLVGGLWSTSEEAGIDDLDTAALGYADDDVSRFSYRGGSTETTSYGADDSTADIRQSARRLRQYLQQTEAENPGVPIDVIAHSQGGLVAREALTNEFDGLDPTLPQVSSLVTLGTPHHGTDLATAGAMVGASSIGHLAERGVGTVTPWDATAPALQQMSEVSTFIHDLNDRPLPEGLHATAIGARGDWIVPAGQTSFAGADHVIVSVPGIAGDHWDLPGSDQAEREVALAVNHMAPTCQSFVDAMADAYVSGALSQIEDGAGLGLWWLGRRRDPPVPSPRDVLLNRGS
ncbi:MAG: hypothetical protein QOE93_2298, partial [Actinomycetota bacterium]|nr:hypothetical protein [Actinomycetota bacterium]